MVGDVADCRRPGIVHACICVLAAVVSLIVCACSRLAPDQETSTGIPDIEQIQAVVGDGFDALSAGDYAWFNRLQCKEQQSGGAPPASGPDVAALRGVRLDSVDVIKIVGDSATAITHHHSNAAPDKKLSDTVILKRENAMWMLC